MRILTVRQPWAGAIIWRGKDIENRTRNIAGEYRGPVAIHVALRHDYAGVDAHNAIVGYIDEHSAYGYGAIIGVVDIVGVHDTRQDGMLRWHCSPWAEYRPQRRLWHLKLGNPRALPEPISFNGALGLRELPADMAERIQREAVPV